MSRRYRQELEKAKNVNKEVEEEKDKIKLLREKIYAPVIWQRLGTGFRIEDLKENRYEEVVNMIKDYYITEEVLCRNAEMADDDVSTESFLKHALFNIKDNKSLIMIDERQELQEGQEVQDGQQEQEKQEEKEEDLVGALILKAIHKDDFGRVFSRALLVEGEAQQKCVKLKNSLNRKVDIFVDFNCDVYLRYYALCVKPMYRKKGKQISYIAFAHLYLLSFKSGLGFHLMRCGLQIARACSIPVVMGIFTSFNIQKLAKKIGMKVIHEIGYVQWRDDDGELVFSDPGAGNYTCAIMAGHVPESLIALPLIPGPPTSSKAAEAQVPTEPKMTRKEKRATKKGKSK